MKILAAFLAAAAFLLDIGHCLASDLPVTDEVLPCGVRLLIQQEPDTQLVAVNVFVKTAGAPEDASHPGLANLTARVLLTGTTNQTSETISQQINVLGGNVNTIWDRNFTQLRSLTLASQFDDSAYLISDVLKNATLSDASIAQAKLDILQGLQDQSDDVYQQAYNQLKDALYRNQEISPTDVGDPAVIANLRPSDVRTFFNRYYTADNIVISVVGNVDPNHVATVFGDDLSDFSRRTAQRNPSMASYNPAPLKAPVIVKSYRGDLNGGYVMVGYLVPGAGSEDYPELLLLNALLGGMKTSLLFTNLREKQGLGYDTSSSYSEDVGTADLVGYILSSGDKPSGLPTTAKMQTIAAGDGSAGPSFAGVRDALVEQFRVLRTTPPTPQMLQRAKRYVVGSYLISHERLLDRAYWLGFSEIALTPIGGYRFDTHFGDIVDAVTADDLQRVAQQYLSAGYVISMVLPGDPNAGNVSR